MERKNEQQLICGKGTCRNALRAGFDGGRYHQSSAVVDRAKKATSPVTGPGVSWPARSRPPISSANPPNRYQAAKSHGLQSGRSL
jgi:hypothetical protein